MAEESWGTESQLSGQNGTEPSHVVDAGRPVEPPGIEKPQPAAPQLIKADIGKRAVAAMVDIAIAFFVGMIPIIGGIIGGAYMALRDGFTFEPVNGQSFGKKLFDLKAVSAVSGEPCDYMLSIRRNLPFVVPALSMVFSIFGKYVLLGAAYIWLAVLVIEFLLAFTDPKGERLGDKIAGTRVVEISSQP